ncbi:hypothetical protein B0H11DRAFT_1905095 [Mycena galericulata]|nr:hypothetical protein B0H11DRAFT_1905095 [Mycena galericulata]
MRSRACVVVGVVGAVGCRLFDFRSGIGLSLSTLHAHCLASIPADFFYVLAAPGLLAASSTLLSTTTLLVTRSGTVYTISAAAEEARQCILRYIRSLPRGDQILIHQFYNAYKDKFGFVYCNIRWLEDIDGPRVIVKAERTDNLERQMEQYAQCGPSQILWVSCYPTEHAKAAKQMVHLKLDLLGVKIMPFLCTCRTRHQEVNVHNGWRGTQSVDRRLDGDQYGRTVRVSKARSSIRIDKIHLLHASFS